MAEDADPLASAEILEGCALAFLPLDSAGRCVHPSIDQLESASDSIGPTGRQLRQAVQAKAMDFIADRLALVNLKDGLGLRLCCVAHGLARPEIRQ